MQRAAQLTQPRLFTGLGRSRSQSGERFKDCRLSHCVNDLLRPVKFLSCIKAKKDRGIAHLGDRLLDLDDLAGAGAADLAGRGLLAATLRAEDGGSANDGSCICEENADVRSNVSMLRFRPC